MWLCRSEGVAKERPKDERFRPRDQTLTHFAVTLVIAAIVPTLGFLIAPASLIRAGDLPQAGTKVQVAIAAAPSGILVESRKTLRKLQDELLSIGAGALGSSDPASRPESDPALQAVNQRITVKSAEANYENAKLAREIAEIAVVEYEEGIFKQDHATVVGEVKLAESDLSGAVDMIEVAKDRLAKIKKVSRGAGQDLFYEYTFEDRVAEFQIREPRVRLAFEKAKSKLDGLEKYVRPKRVKELKSAVEKARSDELALQARWKQEELKLAKLQKASNGQNRGPQGRQVLELLDQAISIADQLKTKFDQVEKDHEPGDSVRKEITDLTGRLQAVVAQAQREQAAASWANLKPTVRAAASRYLGGQPK